MNQIYQFTHYLAGAAAVFGALWVVHHRLGARRWLGLLPISMWLSGMYLVPAAVPVVTPEIALVRATLVFGGGGLALALAAWAERRGAAERMARRAKALVAQANEAHEGSRRGAFR